MKYILIGFIKLYQMIPIPWHNNCKYIPTCSQYAIEALKKYNCLKATFLIIKRILKCNPWSKGGFDPVK